MKRNFAVLLAVFCVTSSLLMETDLAQAGHRCRSGSGQCINGSAGPLSVSAYLNVSPGTPVPLYRLPAAYPGYPPRVFNYQDMHNPFNFGRALSTIDAILWQGYTYPGGPRYYIDYGPYSLGR